MSRLTRFALAALVALAVMPLAAAGDIRLATLVPTGTTWHKALLEIGDTLEEEHRRPCHAHRVRRRAAGEHSTSVKKMRLGTLGAGFLTAAGLADLDEAFNVFAMPFFFESDEEEAAVERETDANLRAAAQRQGLPPAWLGHRRLDPGLLEEADPLARRPEGSEALDEQG